MRVFAVFFVFCFPAAALAIELLPISYRSMQGWESQNHTAAFNALRASCRSGISPKQSHPEKIYHADWKGLCHKITYASAAKAKFFFENEMQPYQVLSQEATSLITGYYIPLLKGSDRQEGSYQWPVYGVPKDFKTPYLSRAQIEAGALKGQGLELVWLDDPVMRFFLHIQGSGHVQMPDGRLITLQFAAKNGLPYTAIGKLLIKEGYIAANEISLQTIRAYLEANPDQQRTIFNHNDSYIFFMRSEEAKMPKGAQGVALTPQHSLAVDPRHWPYGLPVYLQIQNGTPFNRLAIAQDTGSAIRGALRADWFAGFGDDAEALAGALASPASWTLLLPAP